MSFSAQERVGCIYDDNTDEYKQILSERTDREQADAGLLRREEQRHLAADGILRDVQERAEEQPCEHGEEHRIVENLMRHLRETPDQGEIEHRPVRSPAMAAAPRAPADALRRAFDLVRQHRADRRRRQ